MRSRKKFLTLSTISIAAASILVLAGCSSSSSSSASGAGNTTAGVPAVPNIPMQKTLGAGEGALNLVAWAGYAENGSNDPTVNWVTPFENTTGCKVNVKIGNTSDEMVTLMKTGQYDGVSASGDATLRLIYGGDVAPVNTSLVPNYATISDFLKNQKWNSVNGQMYGIPHAWGANVLASNASKVTPAPTSWASVFDPNSPYKGKITAYDSPIYIADAAIYLMSTKPELKITNPYSLDNTQFNAAVDLLKAQKLIVGEYWSDYTKAVSSFESGNTLLGTSWQVIVNLINSDKKVQVNATVPTEGATGWSDTWMVAAKAAHPNCMYMWMNYITSAKVNAQVAEYFGEAPAQTLACGETVDKNFCATYHATDAAYASKIWYWTTPTTNCLDGRGPICKDYAAWTQAWTAIKG
ncbi:MAG TPA: ABC transporter substrate-binding protein [Candidatus Nanopelagicaceae bacterium]|nr:ABC transporter substrate-binding protein [Candidatus Nanopelagicaceae bacterium]